MLQYVNFYSNARFEAFARSSLDCHLAVAQVMGKPLLLGEFGDQNSTQFRTDFFYAVSWGFAVVWRRL